MEGGNGASETSVVTLRRKCTYPNDEAGNLHGWRPSSGAFAGTRNNLIRRSTTPTCWIAAVSAAEEISREVRKVREVLKTMRSLRS